jgi:hypothetical protein
MARSNLTLRLPPGVVDPMFLGDLARELKMSVGEITHGRGTPISAHELGVFWPTYFRFHNDERRQIEREQDTGKGGRR